MHHGFLHVSYYAGVFERRKTHILVCLVVQMCKNHIKCVKLSYFVQFYLRMSKYFCNFATAKLLIPYNMEERKVITGSIEQLIQDDKNFNQHTEYGMSPRRPVRGCTSPLLRVPARATP